DHSSPSGSTVSQVPATGDCFARSIPPLASVTNVPQDAHSCSASSLSAARTVTCAPGTAPPIAIRSGSSPREVLGVTSIHMPGSFLDIELGEFTGGPVGAAQRLDLAGEKLVRMSQLLQDREVVMARERQESAGKPASAPRREVVGRLTLQL